MDGPHRADPGQRDQANRRQDDPEGADEMLVRLHDPDNDEAPQRRRRCPSYRQMKRMRNSCARESCRSACDARIRPGALVLASPRCDCPAALRRPALTVAIVHEDVMAK